jgi:hypothetical protein
MLKSSFKTLSFFISVIFLFLLTYPSIICASKVDASKYGNGFNATDVTNALQGAINSKADTVFVPNMGTDWNVMPLFCVSNQTIIFERGVNIVAKKGTQGWGSLFSILDFVTNVSLIGYGATFQMQKADYMNPALYGFSEWRHCISAYNCTNIKILGLILEIAVEME